MEYGDGTFMTSMGDEVATASPDTKTSLCACLGFSMGWVRGCVRIRALYFIHVYIYVGLERWGLLTTAVLLAIKYTVVAKWRSPVDGVVGLGGLTVQAHCLSGYSHYPPPRPPAQLSLH